MTPTQRRIALASLPVAVIMAGCGLDHGVVTGKSHSPETTYTCEIGSTQIGSVSVPMYGDCTDPECWQVDLRDGNDTGALCIDKATWDQIHIGQTIAPKGG